MTEPKNRERNRSHFFDKFTPLTKTQKMFLGCSFRNYYFTSDHDQGAAYQYLNDPKGWKLHVYIVKKQYHWQVY